MDNVNYFSALYDGRFGNEAQAVQCASEIYGSMCGYKGQALRFASTPHDHFDWQGMIAGESYFALFEPRNTTVTKEQKYDVLRLINTPAGAPAAVDERGLYIARPRDNSGDTVLFKIVGNPNHQKEVADGSSVVDDNQRTLMRQVITDERRFIPLPLTPEEAIAAADELQLAASVYRQGPMA